ncbi:MULTISPECIES: outer membrane channel protein TolC [Plesiomonas]|uniref:Outer membrane channel protein TolC n=1 Tax=Plesiomonas shigelloides TaxID=703 RepID=A0A379CKT3_PLESH|nr:MULTISPECIES: outer membrane channel protein TolC [Plesiomonas]MDO4688826.1 outer membrane channel protein TolC [Plesiomonas sp.]KAB7656733.1 outer membrane channel protein TolC [Plesiomonas shigelloides]KAB7664014.1 outer membrane channel protein TolC [Plesiomonas shigelloides]KAB7673411.1 outer membrane channel protein TolC [Plesiomonas shigelloides]KAB7691733.1 outer membrane channel protein TolC [Plesiomonas shigelloides]
MKKILPILIGLSIGSISMSSYADSLLDIYQQAKTNDPVLRKAAADRDGVVEQINQARASLLPQLNATGTADYSRSNFNTVNEQNQTAAKLNLTQSLYDRANWVRLTQSEKRASQAEVNYSAAQQNLILRVANAYFGVLRAQDNLTVILAEKKAVFRQLEQTKQRFDVGLVAITDVQDAQAQYDQVRASQITAQNDLDNSLENLREITGNLPSQINILDTKQFSTDMPLKIDQLMKEADAKNLNLMSARLGQELSREGVRLASSGHLPTLGLQGSVGVSDTNVTSGPTPSTNGDSTSVGVVLSIPIYSGGRTSSEVRQAEYGFISSSEALEQAYREIQKNVRAAHNNIVASISSIKANEQAVVSAKSALDATEAGYEVGTRTIVDVLNSTRSLYNTNRQLANARYDYLINTLNLQGAVGVLNENNILVLNKVLNTPSPIIPEESIQ